MKIRVQLRPVVEVPPFQYGLAIARAVIGMDLQNVFDLCTLKRNLEIKPSKLREMQKKRLMNILEYAYKNVLFYHKKFENSNVKPSNVKSIEDLEKIPITNKREIQATPLNQIIAKNFDMNKMLRRTTSGSTGLPLTVVVNKRTVKFQEAVWLRMFLENGLKFWDKMAVIADPRTFQNKKSWFPHFGSKKRKNISIFDHEEKILALLEEYRPSAIKGYPSSLAILADAYLRKNSSFKPNLLFTSAELMNKETRRLISSAFEADVFDNYACTEFGLLAWECREHMGYHMNVDSVVIEFINNGEQVAPGERGEIVCTSLVNYVMPLIRYPIQDVGVPIKEPCSCGRTLPLMGILEGRTDDFLTALDGRIISPTVFFPYPFENYREINQFRVIQESRHKLTIQLAVKEGFPCDRKVLGKAEKEIQKIFGEGMQVEFQLLEEIAREKSGKLRKTISMIPVNFA